MGAKFRTCQLPVIADLLFERSLNTSLEGNDKEYSLLSYIQKENLIQDVIEYFSRGFSGKIMTKRHSHLPSKSSITDVS